MRRNVHPPLIKEVEFEATRMFTVSSILSFLYDFVVSLCPQTFRLKLKLRKPTLCLSYQGIYLVEHLTEIMEKVSVFIGLCVFLHMMVVYGQETEKPISNPCTPQDTCHECIQTPTCAWCSQPVRTVFNLPCEELHEPHSLLRIF